MKDFQDFKILKPKRLSNGFSSVQVHYSIHPLRQDPDWIKGASQGMKQADIDREWDCKLIGGEGRVFPYEALFDADNQPILRSFYQAPIPGKRYVIGADASEGAGNPCCAVVLDDNWNEVHHIHGKLEPRVFAQRLFNTGKLYNWALIGVENEKYGYVVLTKLQDMKYPEIFYSKEFKPRVREGKKEPSKRKVGWQPTVPNKLQAISDLMDATVQATIGVATSQTIAEMNTFIEDDRGRLRAASGNNDDRVIATAIALQLAMKLPRSLDTISEDISVGDSLVSLGIEDIDVGAVYISEDRVFSDEYPSLLEKSEW